MPEKKKTPVAPLEFLEIYGASEHNLKNISLKIPLNKLTVITGLSGSGKSSLAFNTVYAEGQRRFLETFSAYARQFLGTLERPAVEKIEHLPPVIAIEQKTVNRNPRSTVGTITEIYDLLRLLYAKIGEPDIPGRQDKIRKTDVPSLLKILFDKFDGRKIRILAPLVRSRKGHYKELFVKLARKRYTKVRIDGEIVDIKPGLMTERYKTHDIEVVVDTVRVADKNRERLKKAVETALDEGKNALLILDEENRPYHYSTRLIDEETGFSLPEPEPNFFSFNSPKGYCPVCTGLGFVWEADLEKIIPEPAKSFYQGGMAPVDPVKHRWITEQIEWIAKKHGFDLHRPVKEMPEEMMNEILYGTETFFSYESNISGVRQEKLIRFEGIVNFLKKQFEQNEYKSLKRWAGEYMSKKTCPACQGKRLRKEAYYFKINGKDIGTLAEMEIRDLKREIETMESQLTPRQRQIAGEIFKEIKQRISFLLNVGLGYLTLNRTSVSLSGGESQRIRLASQIGAQLVNVLYILDEPSIGLHPSDNHRLIESLKQLRDAGNSVLVVEHDKEMMLAADHIIDLGPGAGLAGGEIVAQGSPSEIMQTRSLTGAYLSGRKNIPIPGKRRSGTGKHITLYGASGHNLKNVNLDIPLGKLIVVTGVSGSGKSSLINETLYPALRKMLHRSLDNPLPYEKISGIEHIDKVIDIDQSPIGRTPRSNPATYIGVFGPIRQLFANTVEAKIRGYKPGRFSFNVKDGRCPVCEGAGVQTIEMNFLPDVYITCPACQGKRFKRETLEIRYKGKTIHDVLEMSINQALTFFRSVPSIQRKLQIMSDIGLGYIKLGQPSTTLSGGEAQRIKLAAELSKRDTGKTLYILDEPTTGLHFEDIRLLMDVINRLVDKGNTVIIIEHNTDVIKLADHIIDLGPGGGAQGGQIIFQGTPEELIRQRNNLTGKFLRKEFNSRQ